MPALPAIPAGLALLAGALALSRLHALPAPTWMLWGLAGAVALRAGSTWLAARPAGRLRAAVPWLRALAWLALGFCWAGWCAHRALADRLDPAVEGRPLVVEGVVEGLPQRGAHGWTVRFAIERPVGAQPARLPGAVRLSWPADAAATPRGGERWRLAVRLRPPHALANPHGFDAELRALQEGIGAQGTVLARGATGLPPQRLAAPAATPAALLAHAREHVRDALARALGHPDAAAAQAAASAAAPGFGILAALTVGDQAALPPSAWTAFNRAGIGHLLSIMYDCDPSNGGLHADCIQLQAVQLRQAGEGRLPSTSN